MVKPSSESECESRKCAFLVSPPTKLRIKFFPQIQFRLHRCHGLPDNIETYGLISGLWTSTFAFGAFIGPSISGLLYDAFGFRDSVLFIISLHIIVAFIVLVTICTQRTPQPYKELGASEPLLRSRDSMFYNERP